MTHNRGLVVACAVAVAFLLVADAAAVIVVRGRDRVAVPSELRGVLPTLEAFVEKHRGLRFQRRVDMLLLDEQEFDEALSELGPFAADPARQDVESRFLVGFLKALGLVGIDFQLSVLEEAGTKGLLGVYDPVEKRIVVRKGMPEPLLHRVVVHELTHALDDQHHPLDDVVIDLRNEEGRALQALLEGDAGRVDALYMAQLPPEDRAAAEGLVEGLAAVPASAGPFLDLLDFPYAAGPGFVQALVDVGGTAAVDEAFRTRPATSEEIMHPDRYLRRVPSVAVRQPLPDGPLLGLGVLGELGLRLVLGETLDARVAARAADGWGGDHYVAWSDRERTCVRVNLRMDTAPDTNEVRDALRQWATKHPRTDIKLDGDLTTLTRCT